MRFAASCAPLTQAMKSARYLASFPSISVFTAGASSEAATSFAKSSALFVNSPTYLASRRSMKSFSWRRIISMPLVSGVARFLELRLDVVDGAAQQSDSPSVSLRPRLISACSTRWSLSAIVVEARRDLIHFSRQGVVAVRSCQLSQQVELAGNRRRLFRMTLRGGLIAADQEILFRPPDLRRLIASFWLRRRSSVRPRRRGARRPRRVAEKVDQAECAEAQRPISDRHDLVRQTKEGLAMWIVLQHGLRLPEIRPVLTS